MDFNTVKDYLIGAAAVAGAVGVVWTFFNGTFKDVWSRIVSPKLTWMAAVSNIKKSLEDATADRNLIRAKIDRMDLRWAATRSALPEAIFESDENGELTFVNPAFADLFDAQASNLLGSGWTSYVDQEDREDVLREWKYSMERLRPFSMKFTLYPHKKGAPPVVVEGFGQPICNGKTFLGFVGTFRQA